MSLLKQYKNYLKLHFIVFIWGFTGILGAVITIPSASIVWYRMLIAFLSLLIYLKFVKHDFKVDKKELWKIIGTGLVIAAHWILFFEAIKVSTVSVTLACLSSASLFSALLEPVFFKRKIIGYEVLFGFAVIVGLYLIFRFETEYALGIVYSLLAAFFAALFTVFNGKFIAKTKASTISLYEMLGGVLGISVYLSFQPGFSMSMLIPTYMDVVYLLILGMICTAYAFLVSVDIMKELSPYTVTISVNMEPIYAIVLALLFFGDDELMSGGFYAGALVILLTVLGNGYLKQKQHRKVAARGNG